MPWPTTSPGWSRAGSSAWTARQTPPSPPPPKHEHASKHETDGQPGAGALPGCAEGRGHTARRPHRHPALLRRRVRDLRPRQRGPPRRGATGRKSPAAHAARAHRAGHGQRRRGLCQSPFPPAHHGRDLQHRPGRDQYADLGSAGACGAAAVAAAARRCLCLAPARPRAATGRELRAGRCQRQRLLSPGDALLRPHHGARATAGGPAACAAGADRPGAMRPGMSGAAAGWADLRPGLARRLFPPGTDPHAPPAGRRARTGRRLRAAEVGQEAADRGRRRRALQPGLGRAAQLCANPWRAGERNAGRQKQPGLGPPAEPGRHRRQWLPPRPRRRPAKRTAVFHRPPAAGTHPPPATPGAHALYPQARLLSLNIQPLDAAKKRGQPLLADVRTGLGQLTAALAGWRADPDWSASCRHQAAAWATRVTELTTHDPGDALPYDAEVIGAVRESATDVGLDSADNDIVVCAAGTLPAELHKLWRSALPGNYHMDYAYSCMGYEVAGGLGVKLARPEREVIVIVGDGSYMMLNSELASSVLLGRKIIVVILDNRGYGCIERLQIGSGGASVHNMLDDCVPEGGARSAIDFAMHGRSMGADAVHVRDTEELRSEL